MTGDDDFKSVLNSIFLRKNGGAATARLWGDWDDMVLASILGKIQLASGELPVVLAFQNESSWLVVTTRQLISGQMAVPLNEIVDVKPVSFIDKAKNQLNELDVGVVSGNYVRIFSGSGNAYSAIWSIILYVARRNAHAKDRDTHE